MLFKHGNLTGEEADMLGDISEAIELERSGRMYFELLEEDHRQHVERLTESNYEAHIEFTHASFKEAMARNFLLKLAAWRAMCRTHGYTSAEKAAAAADELNELDVVCLSSNCSIVFIGQNSMTATGTSAAYTPLPLRNGYSLDERLGAKLATIPEIGQRVNFVPNTFPYVSVTPPIGIFVKKSKREPAKIIESGSQVVSLISTMEIFKQIDCATLTMDGPSLQKKLEEIRKK